MNIWLKGLISAVLSGASIGASSVFILPVEFNSENLSRFGYMVLVGAVVAFLNYLAKSPIPTE